jgi:NitT/TauT family transport system substrate-binding protein
MQAGGVHPLFLSSDVMGQYSPIAVVVRRQFLDAHPDAVRAFLSDWVAGLQWLLASENRQQAITIISGISKTPPAVLDSFFQVKNVDYYRDPNACPDAAGLQKGVDAMVREGYLKSSVSIAPLVDTTYLPNACTGH